ncbi:multiple cyclophane-containing RiPP AmcA [Micromonospora robiginosa]|uniref:Multiple cyclophane-containing RiPP AmcA n=1 Tax=Micromonospora robiginosa TaxID=2749844 RepID=A0AAF0P321_9ACTN|nr:multiple cyclophane-containing RiPP AmcA [Micromonospora ferruginea]WMF04579.1 multiple cyclophane-containing RiPP AmcA [Micromonospora ferruginea]
MTVYFSLHASAGATGAFSRAAQPGMPATGRQRVFQGDSPLLTFVWQCVLPQPARIDGRR